MLPRLKPISIPLIHMMSMSAPTQARLRRRPLALIIAGCFSLGAPAVHGQAADPAPVKPKEEPPKQVVRVPAEPEAGMTSVTVAAERPTSRIDRQVYDVKADVGSSTSSAADALNNVPSVAVDADGTVSLRGNTNVQILVDGKPSAMLQGENRGQALNAMPSDDIESIEVINNPGAQFGNEGGGGPILNLVMRRVRRPGGTAFANGNAGSQGRYNSALNGSYNTGLLSFQGGANIFHEKSGSTFSSQRSRINPATGETTRSANSGSSQGENDSAALNATLGYNFGAKDRLAAGWSYRNSKSNGEGANRYLNYELNEVLGSDYLRTSRDRNENTAYTWNLLFDHKGDAAGENFKLDFRVSANDSTRQSNYGNTYAVRPRNALDRMSRQSSATGSRIVDFTGDYELPTQTSVLKLGFKAAETEGSFDTRYVDIDTATGVEIPVPSRTNEFEVTEIKLAVYGSWQRRLSEAWNVQAGVRAEYTDIDINQITGNVQGSSSYMSYIPSAFATYKLSPDSTLRFNYANRIRRPNVNDLNPYVIYRDEFNVSSGNINLRPSKSDSFEVGYETNIGKLDATLRGYMRRDSDLITEKRYFISETVLLTTRDNAGSNRSGGLEFNLSGRVIPTLQVSAGGNYGYTEQTTLDLTGRQYIRSLTALSLRARVNYTLTPTDQLQMQLNRQGKAFSGRGYRLANTVANFTWRRTVTPRLSLVFNVRDLFDSSKFDSVVESDIVREYSTRRPDGRVVFLGLSYRFGGLDGVMPGARRPGAQSGPGVMRRGAGGGGAGGGDGGPGR